tara:strand:- start:6169 stop:7335 length:1167 start_codon:yes stop_codon:yes gene_type:complete
MAYYFLFPELDTTLYSQPDRKELNTGNDEILEIVKERGSTDNLLYPSRILIKFKNEELEDVISNIIGSSTFNNNTTVTSLNLTAVEPKNLVQTLNLEVFAVSQSWDEGTGRYSNLPTSSNGASWRYRFNTTVATEWTTSSFAAASTGSIVSSSLLTPGGGVWYTGSNFQSTEQYLVGQTLDTDFNVINIVKKHSASLFADQTYPTGIDNNGFLIKKPDTVESDVSHSFGELQYFSVDTHTIHPPKLTFKWDDSTFPSAYTGSIKLTTDDLNVTLYRNKEEYNQNDIATFRIHVRDRYPVRQFVTSSNFLNTKYLSTASCYSIRDAHTEQEIIPFNDTFTKISADNESNFFKVYMKGLQPERYYRILFKHRDEHGTVIYDDKYYFKVIR